MPNLKFKYFRFDDKDLEANAHFNLEGIPHTKKLTKKDEEHLIRSNSWGYVEGYKSAADVLVDSIPRQPPDIFVYPIVFLYRHYLELLLKELLRHFTGKYEFQHSLEPLWRMVKETLREKNKENYIKDKKTVVNRIIKEFVWFDKTSVASRYAEAKIDKQKKKTQIKKSEPSINPKFRGINLRVLQKAMMEIENTPQMLYRDKSET